MENESEFEIQVTQAYGESVSYQALAERLTQLMSAGNPYAIYHLGTLYENGQGVEKNNTTALSHYVLADQMGLSQAKYKMGLICEFGQCGVGLSYEVAYDIYKEASDFGSSDAQCQLGGLYERGHGVEQDLQKAAYYYKLSSDNGNGRAKFLLADLYLKGIGVEKSLTEALELLHQAAALKNSQAQLWLAVHYKYGHDLPRDYIRAHTYASLASVNADNQADKNAAIEFRDQIFFLMSDDEKKAVF